MSDLSVFSGWFALPIHCTIMWYTHFSKIHCSIFIIFLHFNIRIFYNLCYSLLFVLNK